ncbi:MAG: hypothetical protein WCW44_02920 [archaeon]|jgi:hypothetical protein
MPTQKRRRFQIKQRQQRHKKNLAIKATAVTSGDLLKRANSLVKQIIQRNTPPTEIEKALLKRLLTTAEPHLNKFMTQSISAEKRLGQKEMSNARHRMIDPANALSLNAQLMAEMYGDQELITHIRALGLRPKHR